MATDKSDIVVIIPYYRGIKYISACISSILDSHENCSLYIIDNDTSGLPDLPHSGRIKIIKTRVRIGFGRAVNIGLYVARQKNFSTYVILNQDTVLLPQSLKLLIRHVDGERLNVFIPVILDYHTGTMSAHFMKRSWKNRIQVEGFQNGPISQVEAASAACMALHKNTLEKVGFFDPLFFMYGEDDDWFYRLEDVGGKVLLNEKAQIKHVHSLVSANRSHKKKIDQYQLLGRSILSIRYEKLGIVHLLKNAFKGLVKLRSISLALKTLGLLSRFPYILRDSSRKSINHRALKQIMKDILAE